MALVKKKKDKKENALTCRRSFMKSHEKQATGTPTGEITAGQHFILIIVYFLLLFSFHNQYF